MQHIVQINYFSFTVFSVDFVFAYFYGTWRVLNEQVTWVLSKMSGKNNSTQKIENFLKLSLKSQHTSFCHISKLKRNKSLITTFILTSESNSSFPKINNILLPSEYFAVQPQANVWSTIDPAQSYKYFNTENLWEITTGILGSPNAVSRCRQYINCFQFPIPLRHGIAASLYPLSGQ